MKMKTRFLICLVILIGLLQVSAQVATPFTERFSQSLEGGVTIIANNMISRDAVDPYNGNGDNQGVNANNPNPDPGIFVDIDNDFSTFNSSNANFKNPELSEPCIAVLRAFLYWTGANSDSQNNWDFNEVKLKLPGDANYTTVEADDIIYDDNANGNEDFSNRPYVCVREITPDVARLGEDIYGLYQVANVEAERAPRDGNSAGPAAGWQIVFIYESPELPAKNITLFDGYAHIQGTRNNPAQVDVDFTGFVTVPNGPVSGDVIFGALEGDRGIERDNLLIQNDAGTFVDLVAPLRPNDNFFNSRITVGNTDFLDRTPASSNTLGFDAGVFELNNPNNEIIANNSTATTLRITSGGDVYGLYLLGLAVEVFKPNLDPMLITQTGGTTTPAPGDIIGFNFNLQNRGNDDTLDLTLTSILPQQITYVEPVPGTPGELPVGVTSTYDPITNELKFDIADDLMDIGDPALGINMEFKVKDECFFLGENCDLEFELQFEASFRGATNPDDPLISISTVGVNPCLDVPFVLTVPQPEIAWETQPSDLDRTFSCEEVDEIAAAQLLEPIADKCLPSFGDAIDFLTLNKTSGQFVPDDPNSPQCRGTYTNTWNFTDACGVTIADYTQTITVADEILPTASDPAVVNVQCMADVPVQNIDVVVDEADNCSTPDVAFVSQSIQGTSCPIVITRIYSVTDTCGNTINVSHVINVIDNIAPTASDPDPIERECLADVPAPNTDVVIDEADNCSTPTVEFISEERDGTSCPIVITRTYRVIDDCNNTFDVEQKITVSDTIDPTADSLSQIPGIQCRADVPQPNINVVTGEADNCSTPTVAFVSDVSNGQTCPEIITRTYSVTDACGNSIALTQEIIIEDTIAPQLVTPIQDISISCGVIPEVPVLDFSDNCSSTVDVDFSEQTIPVNPDTSTIVRTWVARDACGNETTQTQNISVEIETVTNNESTIICVNTEDQVLNLNTFISNTNDTSGTWVSTDPTIVLKDGNIFELTKSALGDYSFKYVFTDFASCVFITDVSVSTNDDCVCVKPSTSGIEITKLITPNNDGVNDIFEIKYDIKDTTKRLCPFNVKLDVFNRWGTRVYSNTNYENTWRGESPASSIGSSTQLPTGTYYYVVEFENTLEDMDPIQGFILLGNQ